MKRSRSGYSRSPSPEFGDDRGSRALRVPVTPTKAAQAGGAKGFTSPLPRRQSAGGAAAAAAAAATASSSMLPPPSPLKVAGQQQQHQQDQTRAPLSRLFHQQQPMLAPSLQSPSKHRLSLSRAAGRAGQASDGSVGGGDPRASISSPPPPPVVTAGGAMRVLTPAKAASARSRLSLGGIKRPRTSGGDASVLSASSSCSDAESDGGSAAAAAAGGGGVRMNGGSGSGNRASSSNLRYGPAQRVSSQSSGSSHGLEDDENGNDDAVLAVAGNSNGGGQDKAFPSSTAVTSTDRRVARVNTTLRRGGTSRGVADAAAARGGGTARAGGTEGPRVRNRPAAAVAARRSSSAKDMQSGLLLSSDAAGSSSRVALGAPLSAVPLMVKGPRRVSTWSNDSAASSTASGASVGGNGVEEGLAGRRRSGPRLNGSSGSSGSGGSSSSSSSRRRTSTRGRSRKSSTGASSTASSSSDASEVSAAGNRRRLLSTSNPAAARVQRNGSAGGTKEGVGDALTSGGARRVSAGDSLAGGARRVSAGRYLAGAVCRGCGEKRGGEGGGGQDEHGCGSASCEGRAADEDGAAAEMLPARGGASRARGRRSGVPAVSVRRRSVVPASASASTAEAAAGAEERNLGRRMSMQDFHVNGSLGQGKFGKVYRAKAKRSNQTYAIKMILKSNLRDGTKQDAVNMNRERTLQAKLKHPNIVRMQNCFQDPKYIYLVLDYASGGDVYKLLTQERNKNGLPLELAAGYLCDALSAVAHLHSNDMMHRDIKAENLLLDSKGRLKLSDFGWAVHARPPHDRRKTMCGTPEYAPPEMLVRSPDYTRAVDVWSLGVLAFELLTGQTPFARAQVTSPKTAGSVGDSSNAGSSPEIRTNSSTGATTAAGARSAAEASVAAEIEAIHQGDAHAKLYGRIAAWGGSRESLFGPGTRGARVPDRAREVVMAMLRPRAEDRLECATALGLPWLAARGKEAAAETAEAAARDSAAAATSL